MPSLFRDPALFERDVLDRLQVVATLRFRGSEVPGFRGSGVRQKLPAPAGFNAGETSMFDVAEFGNTPDRRAGGVDIRLHFLSAWQEQRLGPEKNKSDQERVSAHSGFEEDQISSRASRGIAAGCPAASQDRPEGHEEICRDVPCTRERVGFPPCAQDVKNNPVKAFITGATVTT